jgi:high-affinity iron transporter
MRRPIYGGTTAGILLSVATALVVGEVLAMHPGSAEVLEGITMLLAAAVLFFVSYWLVSKAEADKWQRYIRGKVQRAVTTGRSLALASAAFLAVYREGVETVLFYRALYASASAGSVTISAGFAAGAVALLLVYVLFRRLQVQIPIRQFFFVTGLLLYVMAAIFAGQGIHELQEAGVVSLTAVPWALTVPLLGVYPSAESLGLQGVFILLLAYATLVTVRASQSAAAPDDHDVTVELHALRSAIDGLRAEISGAIRRGAGEAMSAPQAERLQAVLTQAEHVASRVSITPPANGRTNGGGRRDS